MQEGKTMSAKSKIKSTFSLLILTGLLLAAPRGAVADIPFEATGHVVGTQSARFRAVVSVDLDGDGDPDLITGSDSHAGYELVAWENDGSPFEAGWSPHNIGDLSTVFGIAVGDIDNDDDIDIVSGQDSAPRLLVWENDGTPFVGSWTSQSIGTPPARVEDVAVGDLDNDGDLDVVTGTSSGGGSPSNDYKVMAWENDGSPFTDTWTPNDVYTVTYLVHAVAVGDLDNDGWPDIVAGIHHATAVGDGNNPAPPETWYPNYELRAYQNDGTPFTGAWPQTNVGRDPETATFASGRYHGYWGAPVYSVALADLDNDGDLDIASGEDIVGDYQIKVWENDGTPFDGQPEEEHWTWQPTAVWVGHPSPWMASTVYDVKTGDTNSDGYVDLATASGEFYETVVWENDGHPFGTVITDTTWIRNNMGQYTSEGALAVAAGDFDKDGYLDIAHGSGDYWSAGGDHDVVIWRNRSGLYDPTHIIIEDQPTISGSEFMTATLGTGAEVTLYSNSHDDFDSFHENVAASWSLIDISGDVTSTDLVPAGDNRSATFTANQIGAARVLAHHDVFTDDTTGFITVTLEITAAPDPVIVGDIGAIVTATLVNQDLTPVTDGTVVTFTTNLGSFDGQTTITRTTVSGVTTANLTSHDVGTATVTLIGDTSQGWVDVTFLPGEPYAVTLEANPTSIIANGSATSTITATVVDQYTHLVTDGTVVTFTTDLGSFPTAPYTSTTVGGLAVAILTSSTDLGTATVTATAANAAGSTGVPFVPGEPYTVTVEASPTSITADGVSASTVTATVTDQWQHPVADGTLVTFTTSLGSFPTTPYTRSTTNGLATAVLTSSTQAGTSVVTATTGATSGTAEVTFTPGAPATLTLTVAPSESSVEASIAVTATLTDQYGNAVADGTPITFTTSLDLGSGGFSPAVGYTTDGLAVSVLASTRTGSGILTATTTGGINHSALIAFTPGALASFGLNGYPVSVQAGAPFTGIAVTAYDTFGNVKTDYTGAVHFTSTDVQATLPFTDSNVYNFTLSDAGQHSFAESYVLRTMGTQRIAVTDGTIAQTSSGITVTPGILASFEITAPTQAIAGQPFTMTITAYDLFSNVIFNFGENVSLFTSNGGTISPTVAQGADFVAGTWTGPVTLSEAGEDRVVVVGFGDVNNQITIDLAQASDEMPYKIFLPAVLRNS
jgi:hypothetical protein